MAYATGSATSAADLLTALQNACTANGWTLAGSVLHNGTAYTRLQVVGNYLEVLGGTGIDGSNNLTGAGPGAARLQPLTTSAWSWPALYHVMVFADEVYLIVQHGVGRWLWLAFGASPAPGIASAGRWYGASVPDADPYKCRIGFGTGTVVSTSQLICSMAPFWRPDNISASLMNTFAQVDLDSITWTGETAPQGVVSATADRAATLLLKSQPNAWNSQTTLVPIKAYMQRASSKVSPIITLGNARYTRVDNFTDADILTIGADKWMVFPFYMKNTADRDGTTFYGGVLEDTGTFGWAIRYDGP